MVSLAKVSKLSHKTPSQWPGASGFVNFETIFVYFESRGIALYGCIAHPSRHSLSHALLEGERESAVASVTALVSQLLGCEATLGGNGLMVKAHKMLDAQVVDVGIIGDAFLYEITAQIGAVGANGLGQLEQGQVVLQVELCVDAMPL